MKQKRRSRPDASDVEARFPHAMIIEARYIYKIIEDGEKHFYKLDKK